MQFKLLNGQVLGEQNEKGLWIYKSNPNFFPKAPFKKNGNLKAQYHDLPRFRPILEYEKEVKESYQKEVLESAVKESVQKLLSFIHQS